MSVSIPLDWHRLGAVRFDPVSVLLIAVGVLYGIGVDVDEPLAAEPMC